jgi:hypothetical protein
MRCNDGTLLPGFPISVGQGWYLDKPANAADLTGDGRPEILVSATDGASLRKLLIFRPDGTPLPIELAGANHIRSAIRRRYARRC